MAKKEKVNEKEKHAGKGAGGILRRITLPLSEAEVAKYRTFIVGMAAISSGVFAFWDGFGRWWFGYWPGAWVAITMVIALIVVWLMAVCQYLARLEKNERKFPRWNAVFMIALPVLVLGISLACVTLHWRNTQKIVILVESFEGIGKDSYHVAKAIKSELERSIAFLDRHRITVVLAKQYDRERSKDVPLEERALKYRADMVISGWYTEVKSEPPEGDSKILITANFHVVRVPQSLPATFRRREGSYPRTLTFSRKEIENFTVHSTLAHQLGYEFVLMVGAGAYAAGDCKAAEYYFGEALKKIEKLESPEKESEAEGERSEREPKAKKYDAGSIENEKSKGDANTVPLAEAPESSEEEPDAKKRRESIVRHDEHIEGDEALLHLYMGHCLTNRGRYEDAILQYDDAIEAGKEIYIRDMRYGEILASAYQARGVAYRQMNAFELARQDFETAGGHLPTSLGLRPLRAEEARVLSGGGKRLVDGAERHYRRGNGYLIQREYKHAQAYLEMSVKFYRRLTKGMFTPVKDDCTLGLAESLVRLGETHNRLAKPDLRDDENYQQAIEHLNEAIRLTTTRFGDQKDPNMLKIRADALRHLGEAQRAQDHNDVVEDALGHHADARSIWDDLGDPNMVAGELTRIGNVHRRLDDLKPDPERLKKAICAYQKAIKKLGGEEYLKILYPDSNDQPDDADTRKQNLETETTKKIIIHHLAHSACNLAETHIKQSLDESDKEEKERDKLKIKKDIRTACELLEYAKGCYGVAVKNLHDEPNDAWIKRIRYEERNWDLRDDLAWCLTLYGYALIKNPPADPNDPNHHKKVYGILKEAKKRFSQLPDVDVNQGHRVFNLFALTVPQVVLEQHPVPQQTFLDACNLLRDLTRKEKKVWYMEYVCDIIESLPKRGFEFGTDDDDCNLKKIERWLAAGTVRDGRHALDLIIKSVDNKVNKYGEFDG